MRRRRSSQPLLTPRRQQNSQCIACDYSRSALDRTNRITLEALWDLPYFKHSDSFLMRNVVGNWTITPIYTYESPEYATVLSGVNSNLNGDSGTAIDRPSSTPTASREQVQARLQCSIQSLATPMQTVVR